MSLISLIIPCYNVAPYLRKSLDSVCAQTHSDLEIICINDGSTDGTLDILHEYESGDGRFRILDQPNAGVAAARNAGLDIVTGKYIGFVDPDDYISPVMYQRLYMEAEKHNAEIVCMGATVCGDMPLPVRWSMLNYLQSPEGVCKNYNFTRMEVLNDMLMLKLYRRDFLELAGVRFKVGMKQGSDALFNYLLLPHVHSIVRIPDCLYVYMPTRSDSLVNKNNVPGKKNSGIYPALERIDLTAAAYMDMGCLESSRMRLLNWLSGSIKLFAANLHDSTVQQQKEVLNKVRELLDKYDWSEYLVSSDTSLWLLRHIALKHDFRVRCALFQMGKFLRSRIGDIVVNICTRIIYMRGTMR